MNPAGVFKRVQTTAVNALTALAIGNSDGLLPAAEAAVATRWQTKEELTSPFGHIQPSPSIANTPHVSTITRDTH